MAFILEVKTVQYFRCLVVQVEDIARAAKRTCNGPVQMASTA